MWDYIHRNIVCPALGIDRLSDTSGREAARQHFGCNSDYKIGLGSLAEEYPQPCEVHLLGGGVDGGTIYKVLTDAEEIYSKQSSSCGDYSGSTSFEGNDELTQREANILCWILSNGILDDRYATDRNLWFTVGRVLKKYDPDGVIFLDAFIAFSQQCSDPSKTDDASTLETFWHSLPDGDETLATYSCIRTYANESSPEWKKQCPYYGGSTTMTQAITPFVSGSISIDGYKALEALQTAGGMQSYEASLAIDYETRRDLVKDRLVSNCVTEDF